MNELQTKPGKPFRACHHLGLYPVVDSYAWVEKLLPRGVKTIQLRIKQAHARLEEEISKSIGCAKQHGATLFVNDYWKLALELGAEAVHLGQEDLASADLKAIRKADLLLGISTHCLAEVERAFAIAPSYIACGPIYATTSKIMPFAPQGIERLAYWCQSLPFPIVAIGGINLDRVPAVLAAGAKGVALISAITKAADPIKATDELLVAVARGAHALC